MFRILLLILSANAFLVYAEPAPCQIKIVEVMGAEIFRGPPYMSEMLASNPKNAERIRSESHGDYHLTCTYKVLLNRRAYQHKVEFTNTLRKRRTDYCDLSEVKKTVASNIASFTTQCRYPTAKPQRGEPLRPFDD